MNQSGYSIAYWLASVLHFLYEHRHCTTIGTPRPRIPLWMAHIGARTSPDISISFVRPGSQLLAIFDVLIYAVVMRTTEKSMECFNLTSMTPSASYIDIHAWSLMPQ